MTPNQATSVYYAVNFACQDRCEGVPCVQRTVGATSWRDIYCCSLSYSLLMKDAGLIYTSHCTILYLVVVSQARPFFACRYWKRLVLRVGKGLACESNLIFVRRRMLSVHLESVVGDFFGLPTGRFGWAVRRSMSVGWKRLRKPLWLRTRRQPFEESVNFWRLDLGSSLSTTTSSASIASVHATFHTSRVPKCALIGG